MGIYLFSIKTKAIRLALNNEVVDCNRLQFSFRCNFESLATPHGLSHIQEALLERFERVWARKDHDPSYVVLCDDEKGPLPGDPVYKWTGDEPYWFDCDALPGVCIGFLQEKTRQDRRIVWTLATSYDEVTYGELYNNVFHVIGRKQVFANTDETVTKLKAQYQDVYVQTKKADFLRVDNREVGC